MTKKEPSYLKRVRCIKCTRLLGKIIGTAEIKCHKCGQLNIFKNK
ncbi:Com family DNA-binding transcriptional regulator [Planococcus sp. 107-1]